jgi:hypothetical protein
MVGGVYHLPGWEINRALGARIKAKGKKHPLPSLRDTLSKEGHYKDKDTRFNYKD